MRALADSWTGPLDVLINNAGIVDVPAARTADGRDLQTATTYTGPFLLTNLPLPHLINRVVSVTSQLHRMGKLNIPDVDWRDRPYQPLQAFRDSKLAQVLFFLELQRRLTASGSAVRSVLAHPGIAHTGLVDHSSQKTVLRRGGRFLIHATHGALPTLFAATQDVLGNSYVGLDGFASAKGHPVVRRPARRGRDATKAAELWRVTAALTGLR